MRPFPPRGGSRPDEGDRAQRGGLVKLRSFRHCVFYPRHRQFRRNNHKFIRQPENPKALLSQPSVTIFVGKLLLRDLMAWTVNFDDQSPFEADKIQDIVAEGNLPLKLGAIASPVANGTPNKCLRLNGSHPLFAPSRSAPSPSSVVASQRHLPPRGGKGAASRTTCCSDSL